MADDLSGHPAAARLEADAIQRLLAQAAAGVGLRTASSTVQTWMFVFTQFQRKTVTHFSWNCSNLSKSWERQ
ncbi:hypothetical protein GCM10007880_35110 [Mesorhizobium amorphae]|nr:hypothetical protein GCM10007880_35110 [Mesorhizobium amorphae]